MAAVSLAYKYVAIAVMLAEINYSASRLHLPIELPVQRTDIKSAMVSDPRIRSRVEHRPTIYGFAGKIDTEHYSFSFPPGLFTHPAPGKLCFIIRLDSGYQAYSTTKVQGDLPTSEFLPQLVATHSIIDTNSAYQIATNWLAAIDVDVQRLQKENPVTVEHEFLQGYGPLPIFDVYWGERGYAKVTVMIAGDTGDLLHLRQNDASYSKRPFALIKDVDKLLAIPDEEFLKYAPEERSNLVARFSAISYPQINALAQTNATLTKR